ncbi:MAG: hypothetical protein UMR38_04830 [Candidatus Izemoplasma sp.]|nr:hypothetical protein [Candidatus Izemoplasma sp.]
MKKEIIIPLIVFIMLELGVLVPNSILAFGFRRISSLEVFNRITGLIILITVAVRLVFPFTIVQFGYIRESGKKILYAYSAILGLIALEALMMLVTGQYNFTMLNINNSFLMIIGTMFTVLWIGIILYALINVITYFHYESNQTVRVTCIIILIMMFLQIPVVDTFIRRSIYRTLGLRASYFTYTALKLLMIAVVPVFYTYFVYIAIKRQENEDQKQVSNITTL